MINRILIRIKVVQMLYSYLLTRTEFKIDQAPETTSKDKLFGYAAYLDLLLLILDISGYDTRSQKQSYSMVIADKKLSDGRIAAALGSDPGVRDVIFKGNTDIDVLRPVARHLHDVIVESAVFKDFAKKRKTDLSDEVNLWTTIVESIFATDHELEKAMRALPGFTNVGFRSAINSLASTLRSYYGSKSGYLRACDSLQVSLDRAYDLYHSMFVLIIELTREQAKRIETNKNKHLATAADRNPNMRFVENEFVARLEQCPALQGYLKDHPMSWETEIALINRLLEQIKSSKIYEEYMSAPVTDYAADCEFWRNILRTVIFVSDDLNETLEDKSVYWNDDLPIMGTFVLKTIKQTQAHPEEEITLLPKYKDEEDANFGAELFVESVRNFETYRGYIDSFINTGNWDPDRIAFMDIVIMTAAICELLNYPNIPIAVTMNEYVEIANSYSSPKSGQFVNGILYNVANMLRENGRIAK